MKNISCVALDVSKDSSHIGVFNYGLDVLSKVTIINHNFKGFEKILILREKLPNSILLFEATGIYHRGLQRFLTEHKVPYVMINPLVSAKMRKQSLRSLKTDKKDCKTIAKTYFFADEKDTKLEVVDDDIFIKCAS